ncbi:ABC transporter substrate-binding protein [Falsiroseomonas selenitidurans]|uniref:ABC transporter substrate-binding protein n=1 Tax=Falsiroseomonas selenitidurans TaxID=2716335 RepID=A0ABX1E299_9PROT|nr:ABC transporter substrate-binding protein [Falsiroseomonas selenitidurans]NKC31295.1 ABC transporter substrate-binding protein [Falsiroseomonas selenitidurans]
MRILKGAMVAALAAVVAMPAVPALAQTPRNTVVFLREIDADRYDLHRSTARSAGEVVGMMTDTLVSMDFDGQTVRPGLAERWTVSPDGKLYTFHLRRDVTFCDGKRFTAADVVYSINRWIARETRSPVAWRAGPVKEIRAVDDYTVEYELNAPFSELLSQLTLFFAGIVDKETVDRLGQNFGSQGFNGTGPYCWSSWTPRNELVLTRHPTYSWGPPIYQNRGPAHVERIVWRVVPEPSARLAALQTGAGDVTQYIPTVALTSLRRVPTVSVLTQPNYFWDFYMGFKVDKPVMNDRAVRRAIHQAVDREALVRAVWFGHAQPALNIINPNALDYDAQSDAMVPRFDPAAAQRTLEEAGWRMGSDGVRVKDGQRATFLTYGINTLENQRQSEIIQQALRRVGIEMRIQLFDATVAWGRMATQEFDALFLSYPYFSAGDALSLYWHSRSRPTPNRMNWNNPQTDAWLEEARSATDPAVRRTALANIQRQLAEESPWLTTARESLFVGVSNRVTGLRAHGLYGIGVYKALDMRVTR